VQCTRSLGLGYKLCVVIPVAGQRTHGTTLQALKATLGTEYVVDDCIVITVINHSSVSSAAEINQLLLDDCIVITVINHSSVSSAAEINQLLLSVIFCL